MREKGSASSMDSEAEKSDCVLTTGNTHVASKQLNIATLGEAVLAGALHSWVAVGAGVPHPPCYAW